MAITVDVVIRGGKVLDPGRGIFEKKNIYIRGNEIVDVPDGQEWSAAKLISAEGCMVAPGLIDYHAHVFPGGTSIGIHADSALLCQGVTTVVDQGSAGVTNFDSFMQTAVQPSQTRIYAFLHVSPAGLATLTRSLEPVQPKVFDLPAARAILERYKGCCLGLKIRQSLEIVGDLRLEPLAETLRMAEEIGCPVVVHTTNPPAGVEELVAMLRSGDVFTHVYQGKGHTIIGEDGKIRAGIKAARQRGVIFDTADGRGHYAFSVIKAALADGFQPDVISTDVVHSSLFDPSVFGLPHIMTKYVNLGMPLQEVVAACTATPARLLGMEGKLGTLAPGALADVAIFKFAPKEFEMEDVFGDKLSCTHAFLPQATILNGKLVYRSPDL